MSPGMSLYSVTAIIILAEDGSRLFAKYYTPPHQGAPAPGAAGGAGAAPKQSYTDVKAQKSFEKGILSKIAKQTSDILMYDSHIVCYKNESDTSIMVVGNADENEVLLYNVLLALRDSLHLLFKATVDRRTVCDNYDLVALAIDEIVDDGIILETDPTIIVSRVSKAPTQDVDLRRIDPFSEQGVNNLAQLGKAKLTDWLRQGL